MDALSLFCCFKVSELDKLNNELLNSGSPNFLTREYSKNLIEIDSKEILKNGIK